MWCIMVQKTRTTRRGKAKKQLRTCRVSVTFPEDDYAEMQRIAERKRVSLAWVVRDAVQRYLAAQAPLFHVR
jgi:hypothetical protein